MESINRIADSILELIKIKDYGLYAHSINVSRLAAIMAKEAEMDKEMVELIRLSGKLHDIGKISIPESIVYKNGFFVDAEYEVMKKHPVYSALYLLINSGVEPESAEKLIEDIMMHNGILGGDIYAVYGINEKIGRLAVSVLFHHEKQNGSGYPCGLKGSNISIEASILCLVDYYVAMCEKRPYRDGHNKEHVVERIKKYSGSFFSPLLVEKLLMPLYKHSVHLIDSALSSSLQNSCLLIGPDKNTNNMVRQIEMMFMKVVDKKITREEGAMFLKHLLVKNDSDEVLRCLMTLYEKLPVGLYLKTFLHVVELAKNPCFERLFEIVGTPKAVCGDTEYRNGGF